MSKSITDVIEGILSEGINDHINKITADNIKDGKNFGGDHRSAEVEADQQPHKAEELKDEGGVKGTAHSDASADTQGVLGKKTGAALDAGGDKDVGSIDGKTAKPSDASAEVEADKGPHDQGSDEFETSSKLKEEKDEDEEDEKSEKEEMEEATDKGDMDGDGKDEPDDKEYMDNKDDAIKKSMKEDSATADEEGEDKDKDGVDDSKEDDNNGDGEHTKADHEVKEECEDEESEDDEDEKEMEEAVEGETIKHVSGEENRAQRPDQEKGDNAPETKAGTPDQGPHDQASDSFETPSKLKEDEDSISEDYKRRAEVIFEAVVAEKVTMVREEVEAEYTAKLAEEKARLNEAVAEQVQEAIQEWLKENALEVRYSLRTEIAENFIKGLKGLFQESYIEIPEEDASVVDELTEAVEEQRGEIEALTAELTEAKAFILEARKAEVVATFCEDLTQTQAIRLEKLAEGLEAEDIEEFRSKVESLKEGYFDAASEQPLIGSLTEEVLTGETHSQVDEDSPVAQYASFLSRTVLK